MLIAVGADHAGFPMKADIIESLKSLGVEVVEFATFDGSQVDFPEITREVCEAVLAGNADRAVLVCGTGIGASIAANKISGIRGGLVHDTHSAHQSVEHDNVNVLCIGARIIGSWLAHDILQAFVNAEFSSDPTFRRRVAQLDRMDEKRRSSE